MQILPFKPEDADEVVAIIHRALFEVNSADYSAETIQSMVEELTPQALKDLALKRDVFVAKQNDRAVGTVSLDANKVFTLFVDNSLHDKGVGRELMDYVERLGKDRGYEEIELPASLTAHTFYLKLGYIDVRETHSDEHGTNIIMRKKLN